MENVMTIDGQYIGHKNNDVFPEPLPVLKLIKKDQTTNDSRSSHDWILQSPPTLNARKIFNDQVIEENEWDNLRKEQKMKKILQINHKPDCKIYPVLNEQNGLSPEKLPESDDGLVTRNRSMVNGNLKKRFSKSREDDAKPYSVKLVNQYDRIFKPSSATVLSIYKQFCKKEKRVDCKNLFDSIQDQVATYPNIPQVSTPYQNFLIFLIEQLEEKDIFSFFKKLHPMQIKHFENCRFYIDFYTIRQKIRFLFYQSVWCLKADVRLLIENYMKLTPPDSALHVQALKIWKFAKTVVFTQKYFNQHIDKFPPLTINDLGLSQLIPMEVLLNPDYDLETLKQQHKSNPTIWLDMAIHQQELKNYIASQPEVSTNGETTNNQDTSLPNPVESLAIRQTFSPFLKKTPISMSARPERHYCTEVQKAKKNPDRSMMESMSSILNICSKGQYKMNENLPEPKPISLPKYDSSVDAMQADDSAATKKAPELDKSLMANQDLIEQLNPGLMPSSSSRGSLIDVEKNLIDILKNSPFVEHCIQPNDNSSSMHEGPTTSNLFNGSFPRFQLDNTTIYSLITSNDPLFSPN